MLRRRTALSTTLAQGSYNAVLRSDLWALPALGTGHRLGIQNAPAGGPSQITDHTQNMVSFMRSRPHTGASQRRWYQYHWRLLDRHVFDDVEQCLTTALFTARGRRFWLLRVPLSRTFEREIFSNTKLVF